MLLHKWCQFLMRMMSPQAVGLIFSLLIGVSSSLSHPSPENNSTRSPSYFTRPPNHSTQPRYFFTQPPNRITHTRNFFTQPPNLSTHSHNFFTHPPNISTHPTVAAGVKLRKHAVNSSFAKDHKFHRTKPSTESPRPVERNSSRTSRTKFNNSSGKNTGNKTGTVPNLTLTSKFKVRNGSDVNSTIVFLPRLSRTMGNFSKSSVHKDFLPIIVSSRRRVLLEPKDYKARSESGEKSRSSTENSEHTGNAQKKREISQNFNPTEPHKIRLKFRESPLLSRGNKTALFQKAPFQRLGPSLKPRESDNQQLSESTVFVKIKNENQNGAYAKQKSSISPVLPIANPRNHPLSNFSQKYKRRGRNFDLASDSTTSDKGSNSETIISQPIPGKTNKLNFRKSAEMSDKLFDYAYSTGIQRDYALANSPQSSTVESAESTLATSMFIQLTDYSSLYSEKKAKNLTIYEILKPRLIGSEPLNLTVPVSNLMLENEGGVDSSSENNDNVTLLTESTENRTPPFLNSIVNLPGRSDSSYGVEYVMVNRNNSAIISTLKTNDTLSDNSSDFGKHNSNSSQLNSTEQGTKLKPIPETGVHSQDQIEESQIYAPKDFLRLKPEENITATNQVNGTSPFNSSDEYMYDDSDLMTQLYESDSIRKPKMTAGVTPSKNLKLDSKMFYDYFAKKPIGNVTVRDFPYPEFRPGNMFRYSDIYQRKPILDMVFARPTPIPKFGKDAATEESMLTPTTFNSLRTSVRVLSTFYPNRMQDVTMKFGNRIESTTHPMDEKLPEFRHDDDFDDAEYRDAIDPGFTMERLAYLLIGTCCGLSILCLIVVVIAIKCRRSIVEKRLKAQFRKRMYYHEKMKDIATPWQQQMFDHFMYLHRRPGGDSSCSRSTDSCNCRCVTWSLGARNLDSTRPLCSTNRSSSYLCGQKKLPFGAASTLRYESMLGRKRTSPEANSQKNESPNTDSSHENDSLDPDSDSREGDGPKQCTCIDYNVWPMAPSNVPRGFFTVCPNVGRYNAGNCSQHPPVELRTISRDIPPPVTGSNYLDRSEGVVYWSSNEERLI